MHFLVDQVMQNNVLNPHNIHVLVLNLYLKVWNTRLSALVNTPIRSRQV